jgi:hypothetical protein
MIKNERILKMFKEKSGGTFPFRVNAFMVKTEVHIDGTVVSFFQDKFPMSYYTWVTDDSEHVYTVYTVGLGFLAN